MKTLLWVDKNRNPYTDDEWLAYSPISMENTKVVWIKEYEEFKGWILRNGLPNGVCFDYDLGDEDIVIDSLYNRERKEFLEEATFHRTTGYDCVIMMRNYCIEHNAQLPDYTLHSDNYKGVAAMTEAIDKFHILLKAKHGNK